jgi:hypothetical protein
VASGRIGSRTLVSLLEIAIMRPDSRTPRSSLPVRQPPKLKPPGAAPREDVSDAPPPIAHWFSDQIAWLTSMVVHTALILALALVVISQPLAMQQAAFTLPPQESPDPLDAMQHNFEPPTIEDIRKVSGSSIAPSIIVGQLPTDPLDPPHEIDLPTDTGDERDIQPREWNGPDCGWPDRNPSLSGRGPRRDNAIAIGDATHDSESAVNAALKWLAEHQSADGSWSFDHRDGLCQGQCTNPGSMKAAKNAATAMALMTFLGAGQSHVEGRYKETVAKGLKFLLATLKQQGRVGSWHEAVGNATNYSHGMACLAVCEAYAMARDHKPPRVKSPTEMTEEERRAWKEEQKRLKKTSAEVSLAQLRTAAQSSLNYITDKQHSAGGWRYNPGQPGDTSVVGWMIMALKSGYLADLRIDVKTVLSAGKFLDSVKHDDYGSIYHYLPDKNRPLEACKATTAIGLLCRMYMGWDRNHPGILQGVQQLGAWDPDLSADGRAANMYYNYYATQVMFHFGGEPWKKWNNRLRDRLVAAQSKQGHARGSWHFNGDHGTAAGGRLYGTALAAMTLEVYYRYMPIYKPKSTEGGIE